MGPLRRAHGDGAPHISRAAGDHSSLAFQDFLAHRSIPPVLTSAGLSRRTGQMHFEPVIDSRYRAVDLLGLVVEIDLHAVAPFEPFQAGPLLVYTPGIV